MRNIFKFLACIFFCIAISGLIKILQHLSKSDYCLEDGDCKIGRIIIIDNKEVIINKETCTKNNWVWYDRGNICKIKNASFKVKEVIYD